LVLQVKDLAWLINPSLPLAGNIFSRVVLYILHIYIVRQMARAASQPFQIQIQPLRPLIAHNMQYKFTTCNEIEQRVMTSIFSIFFKKEKKYTLDVGIME
jgi:hypothetical protein